MEVESQGTTSFIETFTRLPTNLRKGALKKKALSFSFDRTQGKLIDERDRQWILRLFYILKAQDAYLNVEDILLAGLVAECAGCHRDSVQAILESDRIEITDNRGHAMVKKIPAEKEMRIQKAAIDSVKASLMKGIPMYSKDIRAWLKKKEKIDLSIPGLLPYLKNWGILTRELRKEEYRKERAAVLIQRHEFLETITDEIQGCQHKRKCQCPEPRPLVFVDESYVHEHHVANFGLTVEDYPLHKPSGKGRRAVIAAAFTKDGFLGFDADLGLEPNEDDIYQNGSVKYWPANVGGDYHRNFNKEAFQTFFEKCVLENLTEPSVIILDRASYHVTYPEGSFHPNKAKKQELRDWLTENRIAFDEKALKADLKILATCHWKPPKTVIQELAENSGKRHFGYEHQVVYLPPYHPEYNAIEFMWGRMKNYIGKNPAYNLRTLLDKTLPEAFMHIKPTTSNSIYQHIITRIQDHAAADLEEPEVVPELEDF